MKVLITEDKLQSIFNNMMSDYSDLKKLTKDYDYYDYNRNTNIDYSPLNFYNEGDNEDWWDDDDWVFQYAERPPYDISVEGFETPLLIYVKVRFKSMLEMFGDKFEHLLKNWFESTYGLRVKDVVDDWSAEVFVRA